MNDLRIAQAHVLLKVHSVSPVRGFRPPSVLVLGEKLNQVQEILYNGVPATEYVVSSPTRLLVRIPTSQVGKELTDFQALSSVPMSQQSALVSLGLKAPLRKVGGIDRLIQAFLMIALSTPGSDIFSPSSGGGLLSLIGRSTGRDGKGVAADLAQSIDRTRTELLRLQALDRRIPPSERLLSATLSGVQFDPETSTVSARVELRNVLGDSAEVSLK